MNARIVTRQVAALLLLVAGFALAACGGNTVRGEAPLAQTSGWRLDDGDLFLALRLRNVNDEPLVVRDLALDIALGDEPVNVRHRSSPGVEIAPGGFETLNLRLGRDEAVAARFARLAAGEVASLPYALSGTVGTAQSGALAVRLESRIYPVPGRTGEFR